MKPPTFLHSPSSNKNTHAPRNQEPLQREWASNFDSQCAWGHAGNNNWNNGLPLWIFSIQPIRALLLLMSSYIPILTSSNLLKDTNAIQFLIACWQPCISSMELLHLSPQTKPATGGLQLAPPHKQTPHSWARTDFKGEAGAFKLLLFKWW